MPLSKANEGYRKEAKVPDKLTQKTVELPSLKFPRSDAVQPCKKIQKSHDLVRVMNNRNQTCLIVYRNYRTVNAAEESG